jgi:alcohol dehydrogenase class IV
MSRYTLDRVPTLHGGPGAIAEIGPIAKTYVGEGGAVLLVADPGLAHAGLIDLAVKALEVSNLKVTTFSGFKSDPTTAQTDEAAEIARKSGAGCVIAMGGGSAMDLGKAVATVAGGSESANHYALCANPFPRRILPKICVPTTSGTGSETTRTAVLTNPNGAKVWLWGEEMKAEAVVLDPELVVGLPAPLTAATGIDALVHAIEACTNANANAANDAYCHEAIRLVARYLPIAVLEPGNLEARGALQRAAALAGIGIDNTGTAIAHNIGHAIASLRPLHHGRAVGLAMLATLRWNIETDDGRFARAAVAMGVDDLAVGFERLLRQVGLKVTLHDEGYDEVTPERLAAQMAKTENAAMRRSNFRTVEDADLLVFARSMLTQV